MLEKRGYSTAEALAYLGVRRRFFDTVLRPHLAGKGIRAGTSVIYEKKDLDDVWERYKLSQGSERAGSTGEPLTWRVQQNKKASTSARTALGKSIANTASGGFASVVSQITGRQKTS